MNQVSGISCLTSLQWESVKLKYLHRIWAPCCLSFSICLLLLFVLVPGAPSLILLYLHELYVEQYPKSVGEIKQCSLSTFAFTFKWSWLNLRIWVWSQISSFATSLFHKKRNIFKGVLFVTYFSLNKKNPDHCTGLLFMKQGSRVLCQPDKTQQGGRVTRETFSRRPRVENPNTQTTS